MSDHTLIAEIVTFRAAEGTDDADLARAAAALEPFLQGREGFVSRHLSRAEDGIWTDYVLWTDLARAKAAAAAIMSEPVAGAFMALIDPESVTMTHAPVVVRQAA